MAKKKILIPGATRSSDVMIDLETLGTHADSPIMSIGAIRFDPFGTKIDDDCFYASVSLESNFRLHRMPEEETVKYWMRKTTAARGVFEEEKQSLEGALINLTEWYGRDSPVWANGTDFDVAILSHAFHQCDMKTPWSYWNARDFRTLKKLPIVKRIALPPFIGIAHNALADAMYQAQCLQAIFREMGVVTA